MDDRSDSEKLLESTWDERGKRLRRRKLALETALTVVVIPGSIALTLLAPAGHAIDGWTMLCVVLYAVATRIAFPLGGMGYAIPTQLLLIPLFALAPPAAVPGLVFLGLFAGSAASCLRGNQHADRLMCVGGDALHAVGPALVFIAFGVADIREAAWPVLAIALLAQLVFDFGFSTLREWVALGVRPRTYFGVVLQIWGVDIALSPIGLLAALAVAQAPWAPVAIAPMLALLALATKDRRERIERAHARLAALERERHRLRVAVRRVGEAFAANLDLDAVLRITVRAAVEALDADGGRASAVPAPGRSPQRRAVVNGAFEHEAILLAAERHALESDRTVQVTIDDVTAVASPIAGAAGPVGVIVAAREGAPFEEDEIELMAYLCSQAAVSASNAMRHQTLHRQALTDELTGLANHRRFQDLLAAAVDRNHQDGAEVALLLLDLDDFKQVNDQYGHQTGDAVLAAVGRCLYQECRLSDEPARYGGEELAVLLSDVSEAQARDLGERLRREIAELEVTTPGGEPLSVTVSVGVAALGPDVRTKQELLGAADAALYQAKARGKNCVTGAVVR